MNNPHLEELAALQALGLLDGAGQKELFQAADHDAEIDQTLRDFTETAAALAYNVPIVQPPPGLKREIMHQLPARSTAFKIIRFTSWIPYPIAACLMVIGIYQTLLILSLDQKLVSIQSEATELKQGNALMGLRLATLEAKDATYSGAKVIVAWDPHAHRGVISLQNLPLPPAGHDYQLWVLDPKAEVPINAGLIMADTASRSFSVQPVSTSGPGFAISLESSGGQPTPTGPILFALAPEQ